MTIATNAAVLVSGETGSGKSSLIATAAEYLYESTGKALRLYTCDGGGYPERVEVAIHRGLIEPWRLRTRVGSGGEGLIEETCARASQGWWPKEFIDPIKGEVPEGVELVPPASTQFVLFCPNGHEVKRTTVKANLQPTLCSQCKVQASLQNGRVTQSTSLNFPHVGGNAYDGLTSMSSWVMQALRARRAKMGLAGGEKSALGRFMSGEMAFDGNNRADYGFAQGQAEEWLLNSISLSGMKLPPIWTCLETRTDETGALPFWGPSVAGQAKTGIAPTWAGNYVGAQIIIGESGKREWRLYTTEFRGADGAPHKYKCRVEPGTLPEFLVDGADEPAMSHFSLGVFFRLLEAGFEKSMKESKERIPEVKVDKTTVAVASVAVVPPAAQVAQAKAQAAVPTGGPARPATLPPLGVGKPLVKAPILGGEKK